MSHHDVIVIGAGLAGLDCACVLKEAGVDVLVVEAADGVGGRVRTDEHEGFLLDRGFQVFLTAYPEPKRILDYDALDFRPFYPGALVRTDRGFEKVADPVRKPSDGVKTLMTDIGTMGDKLRVGQMRARLLVESLETIYNRPDETTMEWLRERGFTDKIIDRFFRPFYGGVMLDNELRTSSKMLEFTYKMFSDGDTALPAYGMGKIPEQLADRIGWDRIMLERPAAGLTDEGVEMADGEVLRCDQVVVATDVDFAAQIHPEIKPMEWRSVFCVYFSAPAPPIEEPILILNGFREGPINNMCVPSQISPHYAPNGRSLVSVAVLGDHDPRDTSGMVAATRGHLTRWFGEEVSEWEHLRTYHIPKGQPDQTPGQLDEVLRRVRFGERTYICGDHRETSSIEGAMNSGRRAAEAVLEDRA